MNRAPGYWPTRILLVIGVVATAAVVAAAVFGALAPARFISGPEPTILGLPTAMVVNAVLAGSALIGLVWMLRIFLRRPGDEPPRWRYRDRR